MKLWQSNKLVETVAELGKGSYKSKLYSMRFEAHTLTTLKHTSVRMKNASSGI
jgi:hypothetical protein